MQPWTRICPGCGKELSYHSYKKMWECNKYNRRCRKCAGIARRGYTHTEHAKDKIKKARAKQTTPWLGKKRPDMIGDNNPAKRPEVRKKLRKAALDRLKRKGQVIPNYNPEGCRAIDEYGKQHGYNFQHAENGGEFHIKELGYWVDGYDKEKNVVVEYDEPHHNKKIDVDKRRQLEIEKHLGCQFIRIVK